MNFSVMLSTYHIPYNRGNLSISKYKTCASTYIHYLSKSVIILDALTETYFVSEGGGIQGKSMLLKDRRTRLLYGLT